MPAIKFTRGEVRIVIMEDGGVRELQWVTAVVDGVTMKQLEWDAPASDATIAEHIAWLHREGHLTPEE